MEVFSNIACQNGGHHHHLRGHRSSSQAALLTHGSVSEHGDLPRLGLRHPWRLHGARRCLNSGEPHPLSQRGKTGAGGRTILSVNFTSTDPFSRTPRSHLQPGSFLCVTGRKASARLYIPPSLLFGTDLFLLFCPPSRLYGASQNSLRHTQPDTPAGSVLIGWFLWQGEGRPADWRFSLVVGGAFLTARRRRDRRRCHAACPSVNDRT